jgi:serine/threonine-protein kinase
MQCVHCAQPVRDGAARCSWCGGLTGLAPPPPERTVDLEPPVQFARADRHRLRIPALIGGVVLVVAAVGVSVALAATRHSTAAPAPARPAGTAAPAASPSAEPASNAELSQQPSDKADLDTEVSHDRNTAAALVGEWVPQLSSKRPGLVVNGTTYDYPAIWADFQQLRQEHPGALLLWSGDYTSFKSPDFYVTVVAQSFPDGASANEWCDEAGLGPDDCYAKLLSHSLGSPESTLLR